MLGSGIFSNVVIYCPEIALERDECFKEDRRSFLLNYTGWFHKVSLPGKYGRKVHPERDGCDLNGKRIQKKEGVHLCI